MVGSTLGTGRADRCGRDGHPQEKEDRAPFGPSVWFAIEGGRDAGADPRRLLPMLCKAGGIDKTAIGAIRIVGDKSYAEIAKDKVEGFMATLGGDMALDDGSALERLNEAPNLPERSKPPFRKGGGRGGFGGGKPGYKGERKGGGDYSSDRKPHRGRDRDDAADRPVKPRPAKPRPAGDKPAYDKPRGERSEKGKFDKPRGDKPRGDKPKFDKPRADKPRGGDKPKFEKPKGPPPPKGKPNSKKNKARRSDASNTSKRFTLRVEKGKSRDSVQI